MKDRIPGEVIPVNGDPKEYVVEHETVEEKEELVQETENVIWVGETGFEADADKLIVVIDEFRSGHECRTCLAKDIRMVGPNRTASFVPCKECSGKGKRPKAGNPDMEVKCSACDGSGSVQCPACGGRGGLIAIPKQSQGAPTTGKIVSIGPLVPAGKRKLGDRVMFGSYTGMQYDVTAKLATGEEKEINLRILRDDEVLTKLYGILELRQVKKAMALYTAQ